MTHDHAEDFALCDAALRLASGRFADKPVKGRWGSVGLIGSSAKWTRFRTQLAEAGHPPEAIAMITSPIGLPELVGKEPAVIAVAVAAALIPSCATGLPQAQPDAPCPVEGRHLMTLYRAAVMDVPGDPFAVGPTALAVESDAAIVVRDGVIIARGAYPDLARAHAEHEVVDLREGLLLPGLVDTHVHYPQIRVIAGLGMPLLDWLERCALPEESKLAEDATPRPLPRSS